MHKSVSVSRSSFVWTLFGRTKVNQRKKKKNFGALFIVSAKIKLQFYVYFCFFSIVIKSSLFAYAPDCIFPTAYLPSVPNRIKFQFQFIGFECVFHVFAPISSSSSATQQNNAMRPREIKCVTSWHKAQYLYVIFNFKSEGRSSNQTKKKKKKRTMEKIKTTKDFIWKWSVLYCYFYASIFV